MEDDFLWQCPCGHIEHGDLPEDCPNCLAVNSFKPVPEDQIEDAMAEEVLAMKPEDDEDEEY